MRDHHKLHMNSMGSPVQETRACQRVLLRTARVIEGPEHLSCEERSRELGLFSLEEKAEKEAYQHL